MGGQVFLIGPETEEHALELMEKTKATIPLLYDLDASVIRSYRLAFEPPKAMQEAYERMGHPILEANAATGFTLPIPATYVIDRDRKVRARYINADYTHRMEPAAVLAAVKDASGA